MNCGICPCMKSHEACAVAPLFAGMCVGGLQKRGKKTLGGTWLGRPLHGRVKKA
jgi:hypothetical protein